MLKYGSSVLTLPLVKLFNYILNHTEYPDTWNMSLISTIYKKGDKNNCNNYRGISLSSCLSKLFTSLLQNRLITHLESHNFFSPFQAGFRPDHRTTDHIFAIKTIINKYVYKLKKNLYMDASSILLKLLIQCQEILCFISLQKLTLGATFIN